MVLGTVFVLASTGEAVNIALARPTARSGNTNFFIGGGGFSEVPFGSDRRADVNSLSRAKPVTSEALRRAGALRDPERDPVPNGDPRLLFLERNAHQRLVPMQVEVRGAGGVGILEGDFKILLLVRRIVDRDVDAQHVLLRVRGHRATTIPIGVEGDRPLR